MVMSWQYNALLSGEATAKTMGINVEGLRFATILLASLITAACVSTCGQVGWVGLLIPHICRMALGSDNLVLVPASVTKFLGQVSLFPFIEKIMRKFISHL